MDTFAGKFGVITGGGSGMGQELARLLAAEGCHVATCCLTPEKLDTTRQLCEESATGGAGIVTSITDVSDERQVLAFRDQVMTEFDTPYINLLFNNAGIAAGSSFLKDSRNRWERMYNVCWNGVYYSTRAFMPLLLASEEGHIVNTGSACSFWATHGPARPATSYSTAKFAVRGFTESLIDDLRLNAPHVSCSIVLPGYIGTSIVSTSVRVLSDSPDGKILDEEIASCRRDLAAMGVKEAAELPPGKIIEMMQAFAEQVRDNAPTSAREAAQIILDGVRNKDWRILVGQDASILDKMVREKPERAYDQDFYREFLARAGWDT